MDEKKRKSNYEMDRLLRLPQVLELIPIAKSTWWSWVASGKAPDPVRLGRCTCWRYSDVMTFIEGGPA